MPKRMVPLRRRLLLVAIAALVPLGAIAALGLVELATRQREDSQRAGIELTRALATAVDAELGRSISVLQGLVSASAPDLDDLGQFHERAIRVVKSQPYWRAIILVEPDGTPVAHSGFSYGAPLPPLADRASLQRLRGTTGSMVADLAPVGAGEVEGAPLSFSVRVPVFAGHELRYVAIARIDPGAILEILQRQRVPSAWVISIFDRAGQRVARSRAHEENLGKPGAPSVVALMARPADEGWGRTVAVEGQPIYTAYSRVKGVGWTVATGIPLEVVDGAFWNTALTLGAGWLISIGIGIAAALLVSRSIARPIAALRDAAEALGHRGPLSAPATGIVEIRRVGEALVGAAEERTLGEREREQLLAREQSAREAAESANRAKDEFLAMLGHELRNPLGAVSNAIALLDRAEASSEAAQGARAIIARQTAHLKRLTDDLLDAARAITGKVVLSREPLDLAPLVERALATIEVGRCSLERDLRSVWVDGDPTRLEQIVVNLVENAVKYTKDDCTISVSVGTESDEAVLRVRDDGVGMAPELVARVFDLFVQGDHSLDRAAGGLGIGLTLVQRLASLHGGSVEAASDGLGHGSTFTVRFPAIQPRDAAADTSPPIARQGPARDVMVIEDNEDGRAALCHLLELGGHRVRAVGEGISGLAIAREAPPEIVFVDIGLPGIDGYEVARQLRAALPAVLLVALTGYGLPEDRTRAHAAGFDLYLVKPVDLEMLSLVLDGRAPTRSGSSALPS
jgi:signal transduction histidine kinase/CheY-like chemotaxis protein